MSQQGIPVYFYDRLQYFRPAHVSDQAPTPLHHLTDGGEATASSEMVPKLAKKWTTVLQPVL